VYIDPKMGTVKYLSVEHFKHYDLSRTAAINLLNVSALFVSAAAVVGKVPATNPFGFSALILSRSSFVTSLAMFTRFGSCPESMLAFTLSVNSL
jgi:hypothetical protein